MLLGFEIHRENAIIIDLPSTPLSLTQSLLLGFRC